MLKWKLLALATLLFMISCKKEINNDVSFDKGDPKLTFKNVVILGNSITQSPPDASIGWFGDWGMAATTKESDYVHVLISYFKVKNPDVQVNIKNINAFEFDPVNFNFDTELKDLRDSKPDLVIIHLGENVLENIGLQKYDERYTALINYFKTDNRSVIVLSAGSIWSKTVDDVMVKHPPYVLFSPLKKYTANFAIGLYENYKVAAHPSDKGMRNMAALLWNKIVTFTPDDRK